MNQHRRAFLYVLISSIGFGTLGIWGKVAYRIGYTPVSLLFVRFMIASVLLWTAAAVSRHRLVAAWRELAVYVLQGGILYAATAVCFFLSLQYLPASITAVLLYLHPIYTIIIETATARTRWDTRVFSAATAAVLGTALLVFNSQDLQQGFSWVGVVLGLSSGLAYSLYTLSNQYLKVGSSNLVATAYTVSFCALTLLLLLQLSFPVITAPMWLVGLGIAICGTVVGILFYISAIRLVGASEVAVYSAFEPLSAAVFAVLLLSERLGLLQMIGMVLVLAAVSYMQRLKAKAFDSNMLENN